MDDLKEILEKIEAMMLLAQVEEYEKELDKAGKETIVHLTLDELTDLVFKACKYDIAIDEKWIKEKNFEEGDMFFRLTKKFKNYKHLAGREM